MNPERDGLYHPATEHEIIALVKEAARTGRKVRVRGSQHSVAGAILGDGAGGDAGTIQLSLERYRTITLDPANLQATVEAGCNLYHDPDDPTGASTPENGLLPVLDAQGWALGELGGITHQTASGFLSTGSTGGSSLHSSYDHVVMIRIIDGSGTPREFRREDGGDFFGAIISMGLLGVVSRLTLRCIPRFDIIGQEATTTAANSAVSLLKDGAGGLEQFLRTAEYPRIMWWPQPRIDRVVVWQARRMADGDYNDATGPKGGLKARPTPLVARWQQAVGGWLLTRVGKRPRRGPFRWFWEKLFPVIIRTFVPVDRKGPKPFWDSWWHGLPMDNGYDYNHLPVAFTEIWLPLEKTATAMRRLDAHYRSVGDAATGTYLLELYAARDEEHWLSPAYGGKMLRLDFFWFANNKGNPAEDYFPQFWELFRDLGARYHWGKHMPVGKGWPEEVAAQYPKFADFRELRRRMDPEDRFLTNYWRARLPL